MVSLPSGFVEIRLNGILLGHVHVTFTIEEPRTEHHATLDPLECFHKHGPVKGQVNKSCLIKGRPFTVEDLRSRMTHVRILCSSCLRKYTTWVPDKEPEFKVQKMTLDELDVWRIMVR